MENDWPVGLPPLDEFTMVRKRPIVVRAIQVDRSIPIPTREGIMWATPGDWVIYGTHGELYPCKPDIFNTVYESVWSE